jgi:hypothetical protein
MVNSASQYIDKMVLGLIGLGITILGWCVRVIFTNSKKIEKTEAILEHLTETMKDYKEDLKEMRAENTMASQNQSKILELMRRANKD